MDKDQQVVKLLQNLVQQASLSGHEMGVALVVAEEMRRSGFDEVYQDETGNVIGVLKGKKPGLKVQFDAHMDVVPVQTPEKWDHEPFSGDLDPERIWGRGSTDDKGSLAAMIAGLSSIPRDQIAGTIYVSGSVGEETLEGIGCAQVTDAIQPDLVVIGEPTSCRLGFCQRGRGRFTFRVRGKAAHSSANDQSGNAIYEMGALIERLKNHPLGVSEHMGEAIQAPIEMISDPYPSLSTVPNECRLTIDRRLLLSETGPSVLDDYRSVLEGMDNASVELDRVTYRSYTGKTFIEDDFHPAWITAVDSDFVQTSLQALTKAGLEPVIYPVPYCTNGSYTAGVKGIPTVVFGPGNIKQAHAMNENIMIDELVEAMQTYAEMGKLLGSVVLE